MDLSFRFDRWRKKLPPSPTDQGKVERCVLRTGAGERALPDEVELEPGRGVVGDAFGSDPDDGPENEVSLINVHVLRSFVGDDAGRMALSGDNLHVDLDLSEANLPTDTRLAIGEAELRVTAKPHRPCASFAERFGATAAKKVARGMRTGHRSRGVLCEVVCGGRVRVGDAIRVVRD